MAFSFLKTFLSTFGSKAKQPTRPEDIVPEEILAELPEVTPEEERWLLSDEEYRQQVEEATRRQRESEEANPRDLKDGFLHYRRWLFRTASHHVNAMQYDGEQQLLVVQYDRGDTWTYTPVSLNLAGKFADDLLSGSPGTDVWDHLRWRPSEGAPDMRSHRAWITARKIAGPAEE